MLPIQGDGIPIAECAANREINRVMNPRITIASDLCNGKPTLRGKRIAVQTILEFLSAGESHAEILRQYPSLTREDIYACLEFATELMAHKYVVEPVA